VLRGETFSLRDEDLGELLAALARLDSPGAKSVADQITALRLAGGDIRLMPTEGESSALDVALSGIGAVETSPA
jgi:hypothetical protein